MQNFYNYQGLIKPSFAPPAWVFGPVWSILYLLIFITYSNVFYLFLNKKIDIWVIIPFVLNLIFNFSFTYFQFGIKSNILASIDIILILLTIVWMFYVIWPINKNIVYLNIPYLFWVSFATIVQFSITYLNWK
jgi:tryptophan-rich sensory protein